MSSVARCVSVHLLIEISKANSLNDNLVIMKQFITSCIFLILACSSSLAQQSLENKVNSFIRRAVPLIGVNEVKEWKHATILDARKEYEFDVSHLPGAIHIGECPHHLEPISHLEKTDTIIVYCTVGYRSENLGEQLIELGYTNVFNLFGGIFTWKNSNQSVVDTNNNPTERVHTHSEGWSHFLQSGEKVY